MKEIYEYKITDNTSKEFNIKCKVEYNTENAYDTTYYFYDGTTWLKDFIDLNKLSPENKEDKKEFDEFITRVHDYMVHGNIWEELRDMDNEENLNKKAYEINVTATKK